MTYDLGLSLSNSSNFVVIAHHLSGQAHAKDCSRTVNPKLC